jgi:hypothetical protein
MSTTLLTSAERFDAEYPEELEDRLEWFERRLRVSRSRILRLMGVSDADGQSWKEIAQAHQAQAERAEHLSPRQAGPSGSRTFQARASR